RAGSGRGPDRDGLGGRDALKPDTASHAARSSGFLRDAAGCRHYIPPGMTSIDAISQDFAFLDDWEERYRYIIELGSELEPYPEQFRDDAHKVPGCVSQVWLHVETGPGTDPVLD